MQAATRACTHTLMKMRAVRQVRTFTCMHATTHMYAAVHKQAMRAVGHMHMAQPGCRAQCVKPPAVLSILRLPDARGSLSHA